MFSCFKIQIVFGSRLSNTLILLLCMWVVYTQPVAFSKQPESNESTPRVAIKTNDKLSSSPLERSRNLLRNGDFERGQTRPEGWAPLKPGAIDWIDGGDRHGKVIRFRLNRAVAETSGLKYLSDPIRRSDTGQPLQGFTYRLKVDIKTQSPSVILFVKGYTNFRGREREIYRRKKECGIQQGKWQTVQMDFTPRGPAGRKVLKRRNIKVPEVDFLRIQLYAYNPPGEVCFDNIRLESVGVKPIGPVKSASTESRYVPQENDAGQK